VKPILLEIVTDMITTFGQCRRCNIFFDEAGLNKKVYQKEIDEYPPDLIQESEDLSDWIKELKRLYKHRLFIQLIDAKSFMGVYKSLRYRIRKYPTFIVEGKETYTGWDKNRLESLLDKHIQATLVSKHRRVQPTLS
jgi:hypothetical protein